MFEDSWSTVWVWVFVGVTVAGILLYKLVKKTDHSSPGSEKDKGLHHPAKTQIRFAAVIKAEHIRETGESPEKAVALFTNASMRWAGTEMNWDNLVSQMALPVLADCPSGEVKDVIITFTGDLPESEIPTNLSAMRKLLSGLAANGALRFSGFYDRPPDFNPLRFDFKEV